MARTERDPQKILYTQLGVAVDRLQYLRSRYKAGDMKTLRQMQAAKTEVRRIADMIEIGRIFR